MNLLLDTHTLIWALEDNPTLSQEARTAITEGANLVFVSPIAVWEIGIKKALGKLQAPGNLLEEVRNHRFDFLDITAEHAKQAAELPPIHQDPFDRMLIAQAKVESLVLVTRDNTISQYQLRTLRA